MSRLLRAMGKLQDVKWTIRTFASAMAILLAWLCLAHVNGSVDWATPAKVSGLGVDGFQPSGQQFVAARTGPHVISVKVPVQAGDKLVYRFGAYGHAGADTVIRIDAYGSNFDLASMEQAYPLLDRGLPAVVEGSIWYSKQPPADSVVRVFFESSPGLVVRDLKLGIVPLWRLIAEWVMLAASLAALAVAGLSISKNVGRKLLNARERGFGWMLASVFLAAVIIRFIISILLPYWSGDEYLYKQIASAIWSGALLGLDGSQVGQPVEVPNLLYPYTIAPAFIFGDNFYVGIRLINAFVMSSALFPAFAIGWRLTGAVVPSLIVGLLAMFMPSANISAYAVTETLFHPLFLLAVYLAMSGASNAASLPRALALGLVLGVATNVRMPAVVILIAYYLVMGINVFFHERGRGFLKPGLWAVIPAFAVAYVGMRWWLVPGSTTGLGVYSGAGGGWAEAAMNALGADPKGVAWLLAGHAAILLVPYSIAVAATVSGTISPVTRVVERRNDALTVLLVFLGSVGMTVLFTISVSAHDLGGLGRWHSRYYFSALPPLVAYLFFWNATRRNSKTTRSQAYWCVFGVILLAAIVFALWRIGLQDPWFGAKADSMEIHWAKGHPLRFWSALTVIVVVSLLVGLKRAPDSLLYLLFAAFAVFAGHESFRTLSEPPAGSARRCGEFMAEFVQQSPGAFSVVHQGRNQLVDIAFWMPSTPDAIYEIPATAGTFEWPSTSNAAYLLTEGSVQVQGGKLLAASDICKIYGRSQ